MLINGVNEFYTEGFVCGQIKNSLAHNALHEIMRECFIHQPMEKGAYGNSLRKYDSRFVSVSSINGVKKNIYDSVVSEILIDLEPIINLEGNCIISDYQIFLGKQGYYMEPHNDLGDRASIIILAYLTPNVFEIKDGGGLKVYNLVRDTSSYISPQNGSYVALNAMSANFLHEAVINNNDMDRYHIFITIKCNSV